MWTYRLCNKYVSEWQLLQYQLVRCWEHKSWLQVMRKLLVLHHTNVRGYIVSRGAGTIPRTYKSSQMVDRHLMYRKYAYKLSQIVVRHLLYQTYAAGGANRSRARSCWELWCIESSKIDISNSERKIARVANGRTVPWSATRAIWERPVRNDIKLLPVRNDIKLKQEFEPDAYERSDVSNKLQK